MTLEEYLKVSTIRKLVQAGFSVDGCDTTNKEGLELQRIYCRLGNLQKVLDSIKSAHPPTVYTFKLDKIDLKIVLQGLHKLEMHHLESMENFYNTGNETSRKTQEEIADDVFDVIAQIKSQMNNQG